MDVTASLQATTKDVTV